MSDLRQMMDARGTALPLLETPDANAVRAYGDFLFLAFRSPRHVAMPTGQLRTMLEPPLALGQYHIFRFDGVARGAFTWARLNREAEQRMFGDEGLRPDDWTSGDRLWIVDLMAPYPGMTRSIVRWIMEPGKFTTRDFRFRRMQGRSTTRRVVHIDFQRDRLSRVMNEATFLAEGQGALPPLA